MDLSGLLGNSFVQGGAALGVVGGALATLRNIPNQLYSWLRRQFMVRLTVRDEDLVWWLGLWLAEQPYAQKCRLLDVYSRNTDDGKVPIMRPGMGLHAFRYRKKRIWMAHALEDMGNLGKKNVMELWSYGRSIAPLRELMEDVAALANEDRGDKLRILINEKWGGWEEIQLVHKRYAKSLFLPEKQELLADAKRFFANEQWYRDRGIPHRRGYLLHGPAGNGKSTIIQVLASELNLPLHMLQLTDELFTDSLIAEQFGRAESPCIIALEDFEKVDFEKTKVTIPGLLNAIDGSLASEGRILIVTANDVGPINQYFLRPGRIDRVWHIDFPEESTIRECVELFDGELDHEAVIREAVDNQWSMARVHQELIKHIKDLPEGEFIAPVKVSGPKEKTQAPRIWKR